MSDANQRRGLLGDLSRRLALLSTADLRLIDRCVLTLERLKHDAVGEIQRNPLASGLIDELAELEAEDQRRAELHEAARREMLGEQARQVAEHERAIDAAALEFFGPDPTRESDEPARLALDDLDEPYADWDVRDEHGGEAG